MTTARRPGPLVEVGAALLTVVLVATAAWLGYWQYDAWRERRAAEARDVTRVEPVPMTELVGSDDAFPGREVGRPVRVEGSWLGGGFWVADRAHEGRAGYWAVNPLAVAGSEAAVLVVRGWAPSADAGLLEVSGDAEVVGWLQPPEGSGIPDDDPSDDVFPELRVADAVQRVDTDLYSAYVVTDPTRSEDVSGSLEPAALDALPPVGRFTALRNLLYALEWWIFGAFAAFVWWRWRKDATSGSIG